MATVVNTVFQFKRGYAEAWERVNPILDAGEPGWTLDTHVLKIGDGITPWNNLKTTLSGGQIEEADIQKAVEEYLKKHPIKTNFTKLTLINDIPDIEALSSIVNAKQGDIAVIERKTSSVTTMTAYIYSNTEWQALNGNYNAENVYFDEDFIFTTKIGTVQTLVNGSAVKPAAGKNIKEFFSSLFATEVNPEKTEPSISITLTNSGIHEVGTTLTPKYTASFEDGKYSYGPEPTGATVETWEVTSSENEKWDTSAGNCKNITIADNTNYYVTAKATHTAGFIPKTNIGNDCVDTSKRIQAGTKTKTSNSITGYRSYFYGILDTSSAEAALTSEMIRNNLINGGNYNESKTFTLNANATAKRFIIAIPSNSTREGLKEVILTSAMNTPITNSYVKTLKAVKVEGKNNFTAIDYDVYVYEPSKIDAGEVHAIKLA